MIFEKTWTELKQIISDKVLSLQYEEKSKKYYVFALENNNIYETYIRKLDTAIEGSDQEDFENNFKLNSNKPVFPKDIDGKPYLRAESRPLDKTTFFTMCGDSSTVIGEGTELRWDFSNTDNDLVISGVDYKRKQIDFTFNQDINLKEGTIYFFDAIWGSYLDLRIIAPVGVYHPSLEIPVGHFVNKHFITGTNNLGDELNTEASSNLIPSGFIFRLEITVPDTDIISKGYVSVEIYRSSTV